jgi:hypothetical protein
MVPRMELICKQMIVVVFVGFLSVAVAPARADMPGQWVSDSTGQPIATPTVSFSRTNFFDGSVSFGGGGLSFELDAGHVLFNASPILGSVDLPQIWSNVYAWDSPVLYVSAFENSVQYLADGTFLTASTDHGITSISSYQTLQGLTEMGPSSTTVSVPVPYTAGLLNFGTHVEFNVQINSGRGMILDQDATIKTLTIDSSASLQSLLGKNLTVNGPLINNGQLFLSGSAYTQSLVNAGQMTVATGGSLSVSSPFANDGTLNVAGGNVSANGLTNFGTINWSDGSLNSGNITNRGLLNITGVGEHTIQGNATMTNSGTMVQTGNSQLTFNGSYWGYGAAWAILNNEAGAVYDLQGDGGFILGAGGTSLGNYINNVGLFKKSGGTGTSVVGAGIIFNNTGTVEVDSGTLSIQGGGSTNNGNFAFSNGGTLQIASTFNVNGSEVLRGSGTLEVPTGSISGNSQTAALDVGNGVTVLLDGGSVTANNSPLSIGGQGSFLWTSGSIYGWQGVSVTGNTTVSGVGDHTLQGNTRMTNTGTINHLGDSSQVTFNGSYWGYGAAWAILNNEAGGVYDLQGDGGFRLGAGGTSLGNYINNAGLFKKSGGTGTSVVGEGIIFNNTGTVEVDSGTLSFQDRFTQSSGMTNLSGGNITFSGTGQFQGGLLTGSGTITGSVLNTGAVLSPGHSPGIIDITGDYTQGPDATLLIELAGTGNGQYDILDVEGRAYLGGTLELAFLNGFCPALGDSFSILDFGSYSGSFSTIQVLGNPNYQFALQYTATDLTLTTTAVPEPATLFLLTIGGLTVLRKKK